MVTWMAFIVSEVHTKWDCQVTAKKYNHTEVVFIYLFKKHVVHIYFFRGDNIKPPCKLFSAVVLLAETLAADKRL